MAPKLQIILPAYNESNSLISCVEKFHNEFKNSMNQVQLLIVLNGCSDNSYEICNSLEKKYYGFVKVLNFSKKIGKGGAVIEGFRVATADYISFADVDCAVPPSEISKLYKNIENFDGIIGSRHMPGSKILIRQPLKRRIAGRVFSFLTRMLMSFKYQDTQCGGKIFKKEVIKNIIQDIEVKGWAFDVGLLSCAYENGFAIKEYPITWYHDDNSKIKLLKHGVEMFISLIKLFSKRKKKKFINYLFLQHHYINQGTFFRADGFASFVASKNEHVYLTCINDKKSFGINYELSLKNPYVTYIKLPRLFEHNSVIEILYRIPFVIFLVLKLRYKVLYGFAMGMPTNSIPTIFAGLFLRKKIILDWDDLWGDGYGKFTGRVGNFLFKCFEFFPVKLLKVFSATSVSPYLAEKFISYGVDPKKISIIGNGVNLIKDQSLDKSILREKLSISKDETICISVGNSYGESFEVMIEAFSKASQKNSNIKLYLLGKIFKDGFTSKKIEKVIKQNRELFLSKVQILGHVPYEDYYNYLRVADMCILPMEKNLNDVARFPIRIGDYIQFKLPIVSNAVGVIEYILKKYNYGLVCDVGDTDGFAENILRCSLNPSSFSSENIANDIFKNELDWKNHGLKILKILREAQNS